MTVIELYELLKLVQDIKVKYDLGHLIHVLRPRIVFHLRDFLIDNNTDTQHHTLIHIYLFFHLKIGVNFLVLK